MNPGTRSPGRDFRMNTRYRRRYRWLGLLLLLPAAVAGAGDTWSLDADAWARPRSAETVISMSPVADAVHAWSRSVGSELVLRHSPDEGGQLWADELRDWLIALGVPRERIARVPDSTAEGRLVLSLRRAAGDD